MNRSGFEAWAISIAFMSRGKYGMSVACMNGCRRQHRDSRVSMLIIVPRKEATKVRFGIFKRSEAIGKIPMVLERFESGL
jgi:hypothetical protein